MGMAEGERPIYTLSIPNIRIAQCSLKSSGPGLYKVLKVFPQGCWPMLTPVFPQGCWPMLTPVFPQGCWPMLTPVFPKIVSSWLDDLWVVDNSKYTLETVECETSSNVAVLDTN
jgi:hypothetical protein